MQKLIKGMFDWHETVNSNFDEIDSNMSNYSLSENAPSDPKNGSRWDKILGDSISFETGDGAIFGNASLEPNSSIWFKEI